LRSAKGSRRHRARPDLRGPPDRPDRQPRRLLARPKSPRGPGALLNCNGSCAAPLDTEDCSSCCGNERAGEDCCNATFTKGTPEHAECLTWVGLRHDEGYYSAALPGHPAWDRLEVLADEGDLPNPHVAVDRRGN